MLEWITALDSAILHGIQDVFKSDFMDRIMIFFTKLGDAGFFWIVLGIVLLLIPKTRRWGFLLLVSLAVAFVLGVVVIKPLVARVRPCDAEPFLLLIPHPGETSFPSGHAISSFASATALFLHHKKMGVAAFAVAVLICLSRMYLFVHYPTDVLAGMILGILTAVVIKWAADRWFPRFLTQKKEEQAA